MDERAARERVHLAVEAARCTVDAIASSAQHVGAVARETGLSEPGVMHALRELAETGVSDEDLGRLLERARGYAAPACWTVVPRNVFTAVIRVVAWGVATAPRLHVRPSSARSTFVERFLATLEDALGRPSVTRVSELSPRAGERVHVYGSDATVAAVTSAMPAGVRVHGFGTGFSIAVVARDASLDQAARALASDVVAFDQRGCLSPRYAFVDGDQARLVGFAESFADALDERHETTPLGRLSSEELGARTRYATLAKALFEHRERSGGIVTLDPSPTALPEVPVGRVLHLVPFRHAAALLADRAAAITAVGVAGPIEARAALLEDAMVSDLLGRGARLAAVGRLQRPPLDGPVDLRRFD